MNETPVPKKPTEPFGYIAFGKDGSVRKHIEELPDVKSEQEREVSKRFSTGLTKITGCQYQVVPCEENDHDFWLHSDHLAVQVQATEIVSRDYLIPLSQDEYVNGYHTYSNIVLMAQDQYFGVDIVKKENVLLDRVKTKLQKYYSNQKAPLWLLVWTVSSNFRPFWIEGGIQRVSTGVQKTRKFLSEDGTGPFDEIWFLSLNFAPKRIWPE